MYHHTKSFLCAGIFVLIFIIGFILASAMPGAAYKCSSTRTTMAQWTVPSGASNPPDSPAPSPIDGGIPTTQDGNVSTAFAEAGSTASGIDILTGDGDTHSWAIWSTQTGGNYVMFTIDTSNYSQVHMSFWVERESADSANTITIYYYNQGHQEQEQQNGSPITLSGTGGVVYDFDANPSLTQLDFTGKTNTSGPTVFRIVPTGANNNTAEINFDMITFTGVTCYPDPTLSKTFNPSIVKVYTGVGDLSLLQFTIRNTQNVPNHSQTLHNVTFTDTLPAGLQIYNPDLSYWETTCPGATITAPDSGSTIGFSFGTMDPGTTCTASVYVKGTTPGVYNNSYENGNMSISSVDSGVNTDSSTYGSATLTVRDIPSVPTDVSASPDTVCAGTGSSLSATVGADQTAQWYEDACKTTLIGTGSPLLVTPAATTTYYVSAKDNTTGGESDCVDVTVTVNPLPHAPTDAQASINPICSGQSTDLSANVDNSTGTETVEWFTGTCGGTPVASTTVSPASDTIYYARAKNTGTGCVSALCAEVPVIVNTAPTVSISPTDPSICPGSATTLTANATSTLPITAYQWYLDTSPISGAVGSTYPAGTAGSYTVKVTNACETGTSGAVTLTVNDLPATPASLTATPSAITPGESSTLSAIVGSGETVDWYTGSCSGTPVGSGSSLSVSPINTTTYYAKARNTTTGCVSASCATVTVTVLIVKRLALDFNGTGDYVSVPHVNNTLDLTTGQGTLEAWIYPTKFTAGAGIVFKGTPDACYGFGFGTTSDTSQNIRFVLGHTGGDYALTATDKTLEANKWYHIACVWNDASPPYMTIYVNGIASTVTRTTAIPTIRTNSDPLRFGVSASGVYYQGVMDEVRAWQTARGETDIRANMCQKLDGTQADLVAYWKFDEDSSTVCGDTSGNGNVGAIAGAERICSQAPIGDKSGYDYTSSFRASLAHPDGDYLSAEKDGGTWDAGLDSCIHVYRVDDPPNYTTPPLGWDSFAQSLRYWGVFVAGGTSPTYTMVYHYTGYPDIRDESSLKMAYRHHNCDTWKNLEAVLDTGAHTLTKTKQSGTEFILGSSVDPRNAIQYNGADYVRIPDANPLDLGATGTIEAWINISSPQANAGIIHKGDDADTPNNDEAYFLRLGPAGNTVVLGVNNGSGASTVTSSDTLNTGVWYHIAGVWDDTANTMNIYINGVSDGPSPLPSTVTAQTTTGNLNIGQQFTTGTSSYYPFNGIIDEVRIWNIARSQTDIRNTMCHKLAGTETGLAGYWRFDEETTSVTSPDYANGNTATMYNFGTPGGVIGARICSSAPIGNASAWKYYDGGPGPVSQSLAYGALDYMFATQNGGYWFGTFSGIQLYRVDDAPVYPPDINGPLPYDPYTTPNGLTPPYPLDAATYWSSIDYYRYWGVFLTDWMTNPRYQIVYHYAGNPSVPVNESYLGLAKRDNYCDRRWADSGATLDTVTCKCLTKSGETGTEYVLGGKDQPLAIALASFSAEMADGCIDIFWETATEIDTVGFQLWRSEAKDGAYTLVSGSYTSSKSVMETQGARYSFKDCGAALDQTTSYYYKLEEIDLNSADQNPMYGPIGPVSEVVAASQSASANDSKDKACFISILSEQY